MRTLFRNALMTGAAIALLSGCVGEAQPFDSAQGDVQPHGASAQGGSSYQVLYRFDAYPSGEHPLGRLLDVGGTLYGTAYEGGRKGCVFVPESGCGTVYSISTKGVEKTLFKFNTRYGVWPESALIDVQGTLYGTTYRGGGHAGTVYSVSTTGSETVLHDFGGERRDGGYPIAGLVDLNGTLYGTTYYGCIERKCRRALTTPLAVPLFGRCCGTVYSISTSGTEKVLYSFRGGSDGAAPAAGLIDLNGMLYGTTRGGVRSGGSADDGTVYSISSAGKETLLHDFTGGASDGAYPDSNVVAVNRTLYGTTPSGGAHNLGVVFSVTTSGTEKVLYSFNGTFSSASDGAVPHAALMFLNGRLYGTTAEGGGTGCGGVGCGTVYRISTAGVEQVLYSFGGGSDGASPMAPLLYVAGRLYGTTSAGGGTGCGGGGCGTVFSLAP